MSDNRWIISSHRFHEHRSVEAMEAELKRLRQKHPEKKFRVYRVKQNSKVGADAPALESVADTVA